MYPKSHENCPNWSSEGVHGAPKWPMKAPGGPAPAHSNPKMAPRDLPEGSRQLQEVPLDLPEAAKGSPWDAQRSPRDAQGGPRGRQGGSKMVQVGSKVGPEMRKVAKVKLSKNHLFLQCFGSPGRLKMTPRGPQMGHLDPRGRQEGPKRTTRRPR